MGAQEVLAYLHKHSYYCKILYFTTLILFFSVLRNISIGYDNIVLTKEMYEHHTTMKYEGLKMNNKVIISG